MEAGTPSIELRPVAPRARFRSCCIVAACAIGGSSASAAVIFGNSGLRFGSRWDAAPRIEDGLERSLDGGLRYAMQGGGYEAYRDVFTWAGGPPSVAAFQQVVEDAFAAWTVVDPVTGLGTDLSFAHDPSTAVQGVSNPGFAVNYFGAEIDLFGAEDARNWDPGDGGQRGEAFFSTTGLGQMTLASGSTHTGYAIRGADIRMNSNPQVNWNLADFGVILTHEIGHALGLGDVDFNPGRFIDDNYDDTDAASALATLTNPWAHLVDPFNPAASPLQLYDVANADPGVDTPGVDILMESRIPQTFFNTGVAALQNDDFGGRQFLYPFVADATPGDYDASGQIEQGDLDLVLQNWGSDSDTNGTPLGWLADLPDGVIDQGELDGVLQNWGRAAAPAFNSSVVPEPAVAALVVAVLAWVRRHR